ncbi:MAG: erythrose-4-phosphate dehydrogenase, partial [Pseudomonadales bacterium]|nr:erythrose-4-phosphate dehydrogenase [Pseudomonadales bacterium]
HTLTPEMNLVSNASCTTNCLAPVVQAVHQSVGIESGLMTTIHAYTNDQKLTDVYHSDPYRARSATQSMIPTKTGAAAAIGLVIPELAGKLDGMAVRVPTINVSLVDFSFVPHTAASADSINLILKNAAAASPVLDYNELPLVSADFRHNAFSSVFDANHTKVCGSQIKLMAWYDNEWAFANRMLDTTLAMFACQSDRVEAPLHQNVING